MKKTIWKFQLEVKDGNEVYMPKDAEILCIQVQNEQPCIWALVDTNQPNVRRIIDIYGTGHEISYSMGQEWKYIGTFQLLQGQFVGHAFEYTGI